MNQPLFAVRNFVLAFLVGILSTACIGPGGGGGGGGASSNVFGLNGGQVSGSVSPANNGVAVYTFNVTADTAYTVTTNTVSGDAWLIVYNGNPATGGTSVIGSSWNSPTTTPQNTVSFVAGFTGTAYVQVIDASMMAAGSTYTLEAYTGNLAIGTARTASTYNNSIYYSFEAVGGTTYQVQLTPQSGNVDISSVNAKQAASVGSSLLAGTAMETVTFQAPATQRYYVRVAPTSVASTFNVKVVTSTARPDLQVAVNSAVSNGTNLTINYTVSNIGTAAASSIRLDAWANAAGIPAVGATGQASATIASLAAGASATNSIVVPNAGASGTAYAVVDTLNTVAEANETNNVSAGVAWVAPVVIAGYNFEDGLVPATAVMTGNLAWVNVAGGPAGSTRALQAGAITALQTSCVEFSQANSSSISFDYSVSSEPNFDFLRFYIDGVQTRSWSGLVGWTSSGTIAAPATGLHTYKWCYSKDNTVNSNLDTAWIDNIAIY